MSHQDCRCELVTRSDVGHVTVCEGCGQVHLTLQYITLRFDAAAFRTLATMISQAQNRMDCAAKANAATLSFAAASGVH